MYREQIRFNAQGGKIEQIFDKEKKYLTKQYFQQDQLLLLVLAEGTWA